MTMEPLPGGLSAKTREILLHNDADRIALVSLASPAESRIRLASTVELLARFDWTELTCLHPFFGELDAGQWLLIAGWHERRHTTQIERIKTSQQFSGNVVTTPKSTRDNA